MSDGNSVLLSAEVRQFHSFSLQEQEIKETRATSENRRYHSLNCYDSRLIRLLSIAVETLAEFLSKATGLAVEWVQMPGMKVF
ncbi:hypothetical protein P8452_52380 [Trifolium repens]|nr:hypothetical protein P8452_52380 [Trifolium repens]